MLTFLSYIKRIYNTISSIIISSNTSTSKSKKKKYRKGGGGGVGGRIVKGHRNGVLFLDLKKAFGTVHHEILISKLELNGVRGDALQWFSSYLSGRKQVCKINHELSNPILNTCGIPQESNLGPLLFLIYINDLPNCLKFTKTSMFADDTNMYCQADSTADIEAMINFDLNNVHQWLLSNKLTLSVEKTDYMIIGSRQRLNQIQLKLPIFSSKHKLHLFDPPL